MLYQDISSDIIGSAYEVYHHLGGGFLEVCYKKAMLIECQSRGLLAQSEYPIAVHYKEQIVGHYFADLFVEDKVLVELKAMKCILPVHHAQLIHYLKATKVRVGLLFNFGTDEFEFKRVIMSR